MRAVAASPDSAFEDLHEAIDYHPRLVAQNPALSLELVINPATITMFRVWRLPMLVASEEAPRPLVELAVRRVVEGWGGDLPRALLANRALAPQHVKHAVWALVDSDDPNETRVYHRSRYQGQPLGQAVQHVERALTRMRLAFVDRGLSPSNLVSSLVPRVYLRNRVGGIEASRRWVANSPLTAPETLAYLGQLPDTGALREALAMQRRAPGSMLAAFVGDPMVRQYILAQHPNLPSAAQREVIDGGNPKTIAILADNPSLSCDNQMHLILSGDKALLPKLVNNPGLCPEPARYIAALQDEDLCLLLMKRDDLTDEVVEELMQCRHDSVQFALGRKWSAATERVWRKKGVGVRSRRHGDPEPDEAAAQVQDEPKREPTESEKVTPPEPVLRLELPELLLVATARNIDEQTLDTLAGSINAVVRLAVAAHPNTSDETRAWLANDTDVRVAKAATEAPSLPV